MYRAVPNECNKNVLLLLHQEPEIVSMIDGQFHRSRGIFYARRARSSRRLAFVSRQRSTKIAVYRSAAAVLKDESSNAVGRDSYWPRTNVICCRVRGTGLIYIIDKLIFHGRRAFNCEILSTSATCYFLLLPLDSILQFVQRL